MKLQFHYIDQRCTLISAHTLHDGALRHATQRGMSLIEVLVALVIFALSMLGSGALLLSSLRSGQHTLYSSNAIFFAQEFGELMQLVPASANSTGTTAHADSWFLIDTDTTIVAPSLNCQTATCDPSKMAAWNIWEWSRRVQAALPGARVVTCHDTNPRNSDGHFKWDCDDAGGLIVAKFGWISKKGGAGDDVLSSVGSDGKPLRPNMVITLFGNQTDFVTSP